MAFNRIGQSIKNKTKTHIIKAASNSNPTNRIIVEISEEDKEVDMVVDIVQIIEETNLYQTLEAEVVGIKMLNIIIINLKVKLNGLSLLEVMIRGLMITRCKTPSLNPNTIKIHQADINNNSFHHSNILEVLSVKLQ